MNMIRFCLDMKVRTLCFLALSGLLAFIFIIYATSTAQKVSPRGVSAQEQQHQEKTVVRMEQDASDDKRRPGVVVEQVTEVWAGDHGRLVRPGDSGLPVVVQSAPREHPDIPNTLEELPAKSTVFTTTELPADPRLRPGVGNGHVATVVYNDSIYMNGLYNGFQSQSHRARIPGFCAIQMMGVHPAAKFQRTYTLNVTTGIFTDTIVGSSFTAIHRMYAHRKIKELLVSEVILSRTDIIKPFGISIHVNHGPDSEDIDFETGQNMIAGSRYVHGRIKTPEFNDTARQEVHVYYGEAPSNITLAESMREGTWLYLTSVSNTRRGAEDQYEKGLKLFQVKSLSYTHTTAWAQLWTEGRVDIEGNPTLARLAYSSLYYLLSCLPSEEDPKWPFIGLSPEGLDHGSANQAYWGHVLWDQETWQFPPLLMLYPKLAATLLHTRTRTLDAAKRQAKLRGFQGAMYPWESGVTGRDITRVAKFGLYEQHITGDVALAVQQYLYMTHDKTFLQDRRGAEMVSAIAEFWASRVTRDPETGKYGIYGVIPPDEYRINVNNSAYTNSVAQLSLLLPYYALPLIGKQPPAIFREIASNMKIPFDERRQFHPEYDGYTIGTQVKQADVILLGFPLMKIKDPSVRRNDLTLYAQATDQKGPAMTWQMFTIGWLEVKDIHQAKMNLLQSIENAKGPFQVWTENSAGTGTVNFRTGMGGYLQALIFGYGGFRILSDGLYFNPTLPPSSKKFTITGLDYLGNSLNFVIDEKNTVITVTKQGEPLVLTIPGMTTHYPLTTDKSVTISRHKAVIKVKTN